MGHGYSEDFDPAIADYYDRSAEEVRLQERLDYFTTAYFHRPEELAREVAAMGLVVKGVYGLEGPGWILSDVCERMADPRRRAALLDVARMLEVEPAMVGASAHLLAVAQRGR
jgi:hypothetical protein